jgi:hypothetical protein
MTGPKFIFCSCGSWYIDGYPKCPVCGTEDIRKGQKK